MIIYIMRHAEAIPEMFWDRHDSTRPLTDSAQTRLMNVGQAMKKEGIAFDAILCSPYERAKHTAEIIAESYGNIEPVLIEDLASGARPQKYQDALTPYKDKQHVLMVGHLPEVVLTVSRYIDSPIFMDETCAPGEMMVIETADCTEWEQAKLLWRRKINEWKL